MDEGKGTSVNPIAAEYPRGEVHIILHLERLIQAIATALIAAIAAAVLVGSIF